MRKGRASAEASGMQAAAVSRYSLKKFEHFNRNLCGIFPLVFDNFIRKRSSLLAGQVLPVGAAVRRAAARVRVPQGAYVGQRATAL